VFKLAGNGFAYDTAGFSGSFGSANILRQRKWEAQRANQPRAVAPPLRIYPLYQFFLNLGNFNLSRM
tara:strand:- start:1001 stop:1201 length:201 start_codon:yes stop_codon:yes gene_type:complete